MKVSITGELRTSCKTTFYTRPPPRTSQKMVYFGKSACKNNYYIEILKYVFSSYKRGPCYHHKGLGGRPRTCASPPWFSSVLAELNPCPVLPRRCGRHGWLLHRKQAQSQNRGFYPAEFADTLEFVDEEKENPVVFTGHNLMYVHSDFAFRKTPRNREPRVPSVLYTPHTALQ
uniref:Uncharacterized protein n=1 Tax=Molossus molossus TaxID=27622 RepID=A0A7J8GKU3_MOLMO|nr:hypothetical protein HJG59_011463 [Molossus molossus]